MPLAWRQSVNLFNELPGILSQAQSVLLLLPERYPEFISEQRILELIDLAAAELSQMGQWVVTFSLNSITSIIALLIYLVLVPILVFFFLKDGGSLSKWWISFLPEKRDMLINIWVEMDGQIANYIRGKVIEIIVVGVVTYITFIFLGINYAALLAILVGLSVLIPYIGAALVTLPVALIGFFQWGWSNEFMYLMVAYGVIQALDSSGAGIWWRLGVLGAVFCDTTCNALQSGNKCLAKIPNTVCRREQHISAALLGRYLDCLGRS